MRQNITRILAVMVAASTLSIFSMPKDAEAVSLNLINTWRLGDMGLVGNSIAGGDIHALGGPAWANGAFPELGTNIHFGVGFGKGDQIVPFLGIGLQRRGYNWDYDGDGAPDDAFGSAMQFGLEFGGKFFFIERAKGKAPPFLMVSFYKYFGTIDEDGDVYGDGNINHGATMNSPLGFKLSFGAEYYFNDNFALGADFFGLNFSMAQGTHPDGDDVGDLIETRNQFSLYTGLTLTCRFSFTVRASVQFEADYDYED